MTELDAHQMQRLLMPQYCRWFAGSGSQELMLGIYRAQGGLPLGWDTGSGGKMFGIFPTRDTATYMHLLLDIPLQYRHGYELIPENVSCRAYLDVEWEGEQDKDHATLARLLQELRKLIRDKFSRDPQIHVLCGTRLKKDQIFKNSYHIIISNVVFERNHDGQMKGLFASIQDGFTWIDEGKKKSMIDLTVYSRNRHFRLPHCCKLGTNTPLLRISGDPLMDDLSQEFGREVDAVLPCFIVNPEPAESWHMGGVFVNTPTPELQLSIVQPIKRARTAQLEEAKTSEKTLPFPMQTLQDLLALAGDSVTKLTNAKYLKDEQAWRIQGDQRRQLRCCLVMEDETHQSNNCLLFVELVDQSFRVMYFCTAKSCSSFPKPVLGYIIFDTSKCEWLISLSPPQRREESLVPNYLFDNTVVSHSASDPVQEAPTPVTPACPLDEAMMPKPAPEDPAKRRTYAQVKEKFEQECFKIRDPFCYGRIESNEVHRPCLLSHTELKQYYCDWTYAEKTNDGGLVEKPFITKWLSDPKKRSVRKLVVDPTRKNSEDFNMWKGFEAEKLPAVQNAELLVKPIIRHIADVITGGNKAHTEWILDYLANMLQRPQQKTEVAILLFGVQGCGKGILFEFFRKCVLGAHCSYQTSKPENDLFGRFGNGAVGSLLVQVDEVKSLHDYADNIEDLITNATLNSEKKGRDTIVVANLANLVLTSNNANSLTVSPDDRRFALFHCCPVHRGNAEYFKELGSHLDRPEVARAFFQFLLQRDLSKYPKSFQFSRPITEYYKEAQHNSIPVLSRFFSALANSTCPESVPARVLYEQYQKFHSAGNYRVLMTETAFGREIKKIDGITKKRMANLIVYELKPEIIRQYLESVNEYDPDAEFFHC